MPDSFFAAQWTRLHNGDLPSAFVEQVLRLLSRKRLVHQEGSNRRPPPQSHRLGLRPHRLRRVLPRRQDERSVSSLLIATVAIIGIGYLAVDLS